MRQEQTRSAWQRLSAWRSGKGLHVLFAVSLICLIALGTWWSFFLFRIIDERRAHDLRDLGDRARIIAVRVGHDRHRPALGPLASDPRIAISDDCRGQRQQAALRPHWADLCMVPSPGVVAAVEDKYRRQVRMLVGESAMLLLLLGVCILMFYRLLLSERRVLREMDLFFSTVTHELKTPIAGIRALLQSIQMGTVPAGDVARLSGMGVREADRLEHLVENILFSRRLRGRRALLESVDVELGPLLQRVVEHRRPLMDGGGEDRLTLEGDLDAVARVDPSALRVVVENLIDNAFKYGGDRPVRLELTAASRGVAIHIIDRGHGFAPEHAEALFDAFRREQRPADPVKHGTGLGLSLARALARQMGGDVTAQSEGPGRGSRFTLELPGGRG